MINGIYYMLLGLIFVISDHKMIISLVGAYDREQIQAFLNPLISHGGDYLTKIWGRGGQTSYQMETRSVPRPFSK